MLKSATSLIKLPVCVMSAGAALMGFIAYSFLPGLPSAGVCGGVFLLTAGSAVLNNVQDRRVDADMERTRHRPLAAGRISPASGIAASVLMISAGLSVLAASSYSPAAPCAGAAAVVLYNGVYTPLKKRTTLALLPGIACGILPPVIGWLAAGGSPFSPRIAVIMALFGLWQVPHFWLLLMAYGEDYRKRVIPSILDRFPLPVVKMMVFVWVSVFSLLILVMIPLMLVRNPAAVIALLSMSVILPLVFSSVLIACHRRVSYLFLFHLLTLSMVIVMALTVVDSTIMMIPSPTP